MECVKRSLDFNQFNGEERLSKRRCVSSSSPSPATSTNDLGSSAFPDTKMTQEIIDAEIKGEIRRLNRRRQLHKDDHSDSQSSTLDIPMLNFAQVEKICERIISERETELRETYDRILIAKLTEQHDSFVKFSNDQLHRRFESDGPPSYLS